jgi:hypothetical protein
MRGEIAAPAGYPVRIVKKHTHPCRADHGVKPYPARLAPTGIARRIQGKMPWAPEFMRALQRMAGPPPIGCGRHSGRHGSRRNVLGRRRPGASVPLKIGDLDRVSGPEAEALVRNAPSDHGSGRPHARIAGRVCVESSAGDRSRIPADPLRGDHEGQSAGAHCRALRRALRIFEKARGPLAPPLTLCGRSTEAVMGSIPPRPTGECVMSRTVVVTGCSSGFGRQVSERLARKDDRVYATMRGVEGKNSAIAGES